MLNMFKERREHACVFSDISCLPDFSSNPQGNMKDYLSLINLQEMSDISNTLCYVITQRHYLGFWFLCVGALQAETTEF